MQDLTQEQQEDINKRVADFKVALGEISKKFECQIISYPQFIPSVDKEGFITKVVSQIIDTKYLPVPSPFTDKVIQEEE